jgi:hypothetical protein
MSRVLPLTAENLQAHVELEKQRRIYVLTECSKMLTNDFYPSRFTKQEVRVYKSMLVNELAKLRDIPTGELTTDSEFSLPPSDGLVEHIVTQAFEALDEPKPEPHMEVSVTLSYDMSPQNEAQSEAQPDSPDDFKYASDEDTEVKTEPMSEADETLEA